MPVSSRPPSAADDDPAAHERPAPLIALLTDFGLIDPYIGILKGVMLGIAPGMTLVDLTHAVPPQDIETGAWQLHTAWRFMPPGSVFVCVVDPSVGSARRAIAVRAGGYLFVAPDNGLLSYVYAEAAPEQAVILDNPRFHRPQVSQTFHGRDIFSPCAAWLALGTPLDELGSALDPADLVRLDIPQPTWDGETLVGRVAHVDYYGNLITNITDQMAAEALSAPNVALTLMVGPHDAAASAASLGGADAGGQTWRITQRGGHFAAGPEGAPFLLRDSTGRLTIAVRNGSAAALTGARRGARVTLTGVRRPTDDTMA